MKLTEEQKNELLKAYNNFIAREYEDEPLKELPSIVSVAYTTYDFKDNGEDEQEIQVNFNIEKEQYENYIDGELVLVEPYCFDTFLEDLRYASFEDIIRECVHEGYSLYGEENDTK